MGKTGMTRRIDELGRLVIPKEIRKNLKIKDNDQIEINIVDNKIILSKYDILKKDEVIHQLLLCIKKILNKNILFTSRDKIIDYSLLNKEILNSDILSYEDANIIENRKSSINDEKYIDPIIVNGDLYGSLILFSNDKVNDNDINIIKFVKLFLENYLE